MQHEDNLKVTLHFPVKLIPQHKVPYHNSILIAPTQLLGDHVIQCTFACTIWATFQQNTKENVAQTNVAPGAHLTSHVYVWNSRANSWPKETENKHLTPFLPRAPKFKINVPNNHFAKHWNKNNYEKILIEGVTHYESWKLDPYIIDIRVISGSYNYNWQRTKLTCRRHCLI